MKPFLYQRLSWGVKASKDRQLRTRCSQFSRAYAVIAKRTYDDAVDLLNTLQTPYGVLKKRQDAGIKIDKTANEEMRKCLDWIGHSQSDLQKLNIVHVAGTKGKGTTCAYVASILAQYRKSHGIPQNVGLFTSPHLIAVRERIRINSVPISRELFAKYLFEVWDSLEAAAASKADVSFHKPVYFRYLTLMSYHVFLREGVDAAIYETGVGGEYDSTNIVERPVVTGISALGIDHTFTLGETIDKIAWHKAGIQKQGVPSFTVQQLPAAIDVVESRATEKKVESIRVVDLDPRLERVSIKPDAPFQKSNASLAVALAETVLGKLDPNFKALAQSLPKEFVDGLEKAVWRGRCETKVEGNITWYLDGAHTADSMNVAAKWFGDESSKRPAIRCLIFNQQGQREAVKLLEGLFRAITTQGLKFDHVIFCTAEARPDTGSKKDFVSHIYDSKAIEGLTLQKSFSDKWRELDPSPQTTIQVLPTIEDAVEYIRGLDQGHEVGEKKQWDALVTGSVHLVGRALGALEGVDAL